MKGRQLPAPPPAFTQRKQQILQALSVPLDEYTDASPKGSIDAGIRDLIDEINALDGFVTTSSCAGRVSVFVEGVKSEATEPDVNVDVDRDGLEGGEAAKPSTIAAAGGKGGGGNWLFVSHDPVVVDGQVGIVKTFGLDDEGSRELVQGEASSAARLIHFKFEPMILHVLTASPEHAQLLLRCGLQAGFRESGAINLVASGAEPIMPMVAIRCNGLLLESLVGEQIGDQRRTAVSTGYLTRLLGIANERFKENEKRIARFRSGVLEATTKPMKKDGTEWEDGEARRARKREEGLRRKEEMQKQQQQQQQAWQSETANDTNQDTALNLT